MKRIFLIAATLVVANFAVQAQQNGEAAPTFHQHRHHQFNNLSKQLNFTDAQKQQFKAINEDFHKKMEALNKNEDITVRSWKQQKTDLVKAHKAAIQNLLTPEQKEKMKEMRQMADAKFRERIEHRLEKMKTKLNLSDEQVSKIKTISQDFRSQLKTIRENEAMAHSDKKSQIMALVSQQKKDFRSVLTPEQITKLDEWKKEKSDRF